MPKVAIADLLQEWDSLVTAARKHADASPELAQLLDRLQADLDRARTLANLRIRLESERRAAGQELGETRADGKDYAIRVRSLLKTILGTDNEALVQFRVSPRRPYGKRKTKTAKRKTKNTTGRKPDA